jgi:hypothetical protein
MIFPAIVDFDRIGYFTAIVVPAQAGTHAEVESLTQYGFPRARE